MEEDCVTKIDETEWPLHLDALVAAPANHRLLHEDDEVRVLEVTVQPGERENLHHHRWPSIMVVLARPDYRNFDADGNEIPASGGTPASPVLPRALRLPRSGCTPLRSRLTRHTVFRAFGSSSKRLRSKDSGRDAKSRPVLSGRRSRRQNCTFRHVHGSWIAKVWFIG
jgi:hypothetical protein